MYMFLAHLEYMTYLSGVCLYMPEEQNINKSYI
jgi:hypothetical protein